MSLLDPKWKYTPSFATDIRRTFAEARRQRPPASKDKAYPNAQRLNTNVGSAVDRTVA